MEDFDIGYSDFRTQIMTIKELVNLWDNYAVSNRESAVFDISRTQCSRYIEAILIGMPLQSVYVDDSMGEWYYISGGERVQSFVEFCNDVYPLNSLYFKEDLYGGLYFSELSNLAKQKILTTHIQVFVLNPGLTRQERFGIYMCLKPRVDSEALKSCRRKIYPEYYYLIETIAREIKDKMGLRNRSTANLESEICHLLVLINYKMFLNYGRTVSMDFAANELLGSGDIISIINALRLDIIYLLSNERYSKLQRYSVLVRDMYNAARFFAPKLGIDEERFLEAYRYTGLRDSDYKDDVATISNRIQRILNYIYR